ncbi:DUF899 family protein [Nocardia sp. NEAU-G5]|uniref:DUF899 family protein n=1 Tax=Nocardia albiluteola TaxID=2842303 RepID=A0ABS6AYN3_9NOCA|nr:DUF899 family protein [Nocardia albiluteola]MBU3062321.1 DUF899 family protein [Nocardia albiluteola]
MPIEEVRMSTAFPNESLEYREARDVLLQREFDLQRLMEAVAAQRTTLPPGGEVPEDYVFDRIGDDGNATTVRMSELFGDSDTLMLYHYMFPRHPRDDRPKPTVGIFSELPADEGPCPSCTALIDMWDATTPHFDGSGGNLAIGGDGADGQPVPLLTVFKRSPDGPIRLHWASELLFAPTDAPGQDWGHLDIAEPLWTLFDLATMPRFRRWRIGHLPANW